MNAVNSNQCEEISDDDISDISLSQCPPPPYSKKGGQSETLSKTSHRGGQSEALLNTFVKYQRF